MPLASRLELKAAEVYRDISQPCFPLARGVITHRWFDWPVMREATIDCHRLWGDWEQHSASLNKMSSHRTVYLLTQPICNESSDHQSICRPLILEEFKSVQKTKRSKFWFVYLFSSVRLLEWKRACAIYLGSKVASIESKALTCYERGGLCFGVQYTVQPIEGECHWWKMCKLLREESSR